MPLPALETGVPWNWQLVRRLPRRARRPRRAQRRVPRRPLRAAPQRDGRRRGRQRGDARAARRRCCGCCDESIAAGGLGFSTTLSFTHSDGDGQPVASRWARTTKCSRCAARSATTRARRSSTSPSGCLRGFTDDEVELMAAMTLAGRRPLNWNVLTIDSREPQRYHDQLAACEHAASAGRHRDRARRCRRSSR